VVLQVIHDGDLIATGSIRVLAAEECKTDLISTRELPVTYQAVLASHQGSIHGRNTAQGGTDLLGTSDGGEVSSATQAADGTTLLTLFLPHRHAITPSFLLRSALSIASTCKDF
jgi:hypothetical protein